ncbi:MAG: diguanylate cyclase [Atopobiaceae bacterium]|nr:diguanylate cyclase [Atopobiaceae bacterium]
MGAKKIRKKYAVLLFIAILMSVTVIGALSNFAIWSKTNRDAETIMNVTTKSEASALDLVLLEIRDSMDTVGAYVSARVTSANVDSSHKTTEEDLDEEIHNLFLTVEHMDGVMGYSIRFAAPYNSKVNGFTFQRGSTAEPFHPVNATDGEGSPRPAEEDDWYEPVTTTGSPIWIPIRECPYADGYILSYAVPIYSGGNLVGAACIDVDFEVLAKPVRNISIFDNGYAYLTDAAGKVYYHPLIGYGVLLTEDKDDVPEVDAALADTSNHEKLITYTYKGQKKRMAFQTLINGMRLVVTANEEDVMRETLALTWNIVIAATIITIVFMSIAMLLERRTMSPALNRIDNLAHLDGLTGLQNRTSFLEAQSQLDERIKQGEASFGVVMFDANNLKRINDEYGHTMGDVYLLSVVEMIQSCFPGCQAYRIGGDEFVVLVDTEESLREAPENLEASYLWQAKRKEQKKDPWETPSAAGAFVAYDSKAHHDFAEVLSEADQLMYRKKQEMKSSD